MQSQGHVIQGKWVSGQGSRFVSYNPATGSHVWEGWEATTSEVNDAVEGAQQSFEAWSACSMEQRLEVVQRFQELLRQNHEALALCISQETGKTLWETRGEVNAMIGKVDISIKAYHERTGARESEMPGAKAVLRHRPHGVLGVYGPYNFPGHLPNGHIVPALLAGNTIVLKPSEQTPAIAEKVLALWMEAGLPEGVINLVQGAKDTGIALAQHSGLAGILFTGSYPTGKLLHQQFAGHPEKILALEMGGNNPLIIHEAADLNAAVYMTIQSAFVTSGQRCTCARRLILVEDQQTDAFLEKLTQVTSQLKIGAYDEQPEPFMGPVVSGAIADQLMAFQAELLAQGGKALLMMEQRNAGSAFVSPAIIDVSEISRPEDKEMFGPLLQVYRVSSFEKAIQVANQTAYGLSSGILTDVEAHYQTFLQRSRAGLVNWNRPLTGASSGSPFGGTGHSGNHRPSAYYAADYCAYPVASLEANSLKLPETLSAGFPEL